MSNLSELVKSLWHISDKEHNWISFSHENNVAEDYGQMTTYILKLSQSCFW